MTLLDKLRTMLRKPKERPTTKTLSVGLALQAISLASSLAVMTLFPERAAACVSLIFLAFAVNITLWAEVAAGRVGEAEKQKPGCTPNDETH